ncbi:hypothetical protein ACFL6B_02425 [Thermodesulfobacteriota bacterium]
MFCLKKEIENPKKVEVLAPLSYPIILKGYILSAKLGFWTGATLYKQKNRAGSKPLPDWKPGRRH